MALFDDGERCIALVALTRVYLHTVTAIPSAACDGAGVSPENCLRPPPHAQRAALDVGARMTTAYLADTLATGKDSAGNW